jgi:hypothetical protein
MYVITTAMKRFSDRLELIAVPYTEGMNLPPLDPTALRPTRDYLHNIAKVLGKFQQTASPAEPHDWHYGLLPVEVGLATREMKFGDETVQAVLDLQAGVLKVAGTQWSLVEYDARELLNNLKVWQQGRGFAGKIATPDFGPGGSFELGQSQLLGQALWQFTEFSTRLKTKLEGGLTSPVLVYPHHFDLSLVWFPWDDERQLGFGFSTGDDSIAEPYLYLTAYPEPAAFTEIDLPDGAFWQQTGFSGAVLPYVELRRHHQPAQLLKAYAEETLLRAKETF